MKFVSKCGLAVLVSTVAFMTWADAAAADSDGWRIVDTVGTVRSGGPGVQPASLSNNQTLPADGWVETGKDGRVVLVRGRETIVVSPASRIQLPSKEVNGNTQVLQTLGSALYQIGKQQKPHFQVDTPYLAAVVKGTAFTVTVDGDQSSVAVSEGLVQVTTPDGSDAEFVRPGFTASVAHGNMKDVVVRESTPAAENKAPDVKPSAEKQASRDSVVKIPGAIGELALDIPKATEGLASGDTPAVASATTATTAAVSTVRTTTSEIVTTTVDAVQDTGGGAVTTVATTVDATVGGVATVVPTVVDTVPAVVNVVPTVVDIVTPSGSSLPAQASSTAQGVLSTITGAGGGAAGGLGSLLGKGHK